jgi:hypothetical protein
VTSEVLSYSSIRINFTAPFDSGSAITGYTVYTTSQYGDLGTINFVGSVPFGQNNPLTITGLNASTEYFISVQAVNTKGGGELSVAVSATTHGGSDS